MLSTPLDWPTLTVEWLPDVRSDPEKPYELHRLLLGTHTSGGVPNSLQIAHVQLPKATKPSVSDLGDDGEDIGGYGTGKLNAMAADVKLEIAQKIDHPGEVNKARYMPQNPNMIATWCVDGNVMVWDRTKHSNTPSGTVNPQMELQGHEKEGFGLQWNPHEAGHLATGSEDKTVRLWDTTTYDKSSKRIKASRVYTHHKSLVNDVQHHPLHKALLGTVSDDLTLQILDTRQATTDKSVVSTQAHPEPINALSFNPASEFIVATASVDTTIGLWDLRNLQARLHSLEAHRKSVTSISWSPHEEAILGSSGDDRRVLFWDLSKVGEEQTPEDSEDGPPELLFMHGGHTDRITEFSWNRNKPWMVCSTAEDNLIQCWKAAEAIVTVDNSPIPMEEIGA